MTYRVGIVGATGAVGQELIEMLRTRAFPAAELRALASGRSAGRQLEIGGESYRVEEATPEAFDTLDLAIFSAGASVSQELARGAAERGCVVVDNSSAFRMDRDVPLIVPEINPEAANGHAGIIANPNCTTAITLMALFPLHRAFGLRRFFASTYQSVSGSGRQGMVELERQVRSWVAGDSLNPAVYPHQIAFNVIPHVDRFMDDGYTKEELKMVNESRKITGIADLRVSCTCVRVPVLRAHSVAIDAEFERAVDVATARDAIAAFPGAELCDDMGGNRYPMPWDYSRKEPCGVGRIRKSSGLDNGLALWVTGDQLWKGAAMNAIQIAELLHERGLLPQKRATAR